MEFCKVTITFESVDEILWCDHSNETSSAVLSHGTIYLVCSSNFWVCGRNSMMWPFKWNLSACTLTWCYLFVKILENEIWKFGPNLPLATFGSERVNSVLETLTGSESGRELSPRLVVGSPELFQPVSYLIVRIGHFRVPSGLCMKTRLSAQPFIWKWFFSLMQIKFIFTRKVVHLASFWKWGFFLTRKWSIVFNEKYITFTNIEVACHITGQVNYGIVSGNNLCMHHNNSLWR